MDFDLNSRSSRLEKEQQKRRDNAKKKLEAERRLVEEHDKLQRKLAFEAAARKEEAERLIQEKYFQEQERLQLTGGIDFTIDGLIAYQIEGEDDKVVLPENCLHDLINQDAPSKGPMLFQLVISHIDENKCIRGIYQ